MAKKEISHLGDSIAIDSLFGKDSSSQIVPPECLCNLISGGDYAHVVRILGEECDQHMIRAIQRTAALDAIRDFFYAKAMAILEKGADK